jgi:hypothetical protein
MKIPFRKGKGKGKKDKEKRITRKETGTRTKLDRPSGSSPSESEMIYIRIRQTLILPILTSTSNPPYHSPSGSSHPVSGGHLYVIAGTFNDISHYAGNTAEWILNVARLIFDPLGTGSIYTHTTGTTSEWLSLDKTSDWQLVAPGDPLRTNIYEFDSDSPIIPSRISDRYNHSRTTLGSTSSASTFKTHIRQRDGDKCVVSEIDIRLRASHLIQSVWGPRFRTL